MVKKYCGTFSQRMVVSLQMIIQLVSLMVLPITKGTFKLWFLPTFVSVVAVKMFLALVMTTTEPTNVSNVP